MRPIVLALIVSGAIVLGSLLMLGAEYAAGRIGPYQRTTVDVCSGGFRDASQALRQRLEEGYEIERIERMKIGDTDCPTYILRKR